jgi:hypothetical protein
MDFAFSFLYAVLALVGMAAIGTALLHPNPGKTLVFRAICWPRASPPDNLTLPLGVMLLCIGVAFSSWVPLTVRIIFLIVGGVAAIIFGLRRSDA